MHERAQISARPTSRSQKAFRSDESSGTSSGRTATRTWRRTISASSLSSWRSSPTTEISPASATRSLPSSSSSAVVASRPAKTPKLMRISSPLGSCSTTKAMAFSICIERRITCLAGDLTLPRFPAEIPQRNSDSEGPPAGEDGDGHRQHEHVHDGRRPFERANDAGDCEPEPGERAGAEREREDERQDVAGPRRRLQELPEHEQ